MSRFKNVFIINATSISDKNLFFNNDYQYYCINQTMENYNIYGNIK